MIGSQLMKPASTGDASVDGWIVATITFPLA